MCNLATTERQRREYEYYEEYSRRYPPAKVSFDPVLDNKRRPYNTYWFVAELVRSRFKSRNQRLLDIGCGAGYYGVQFARIGYEVFGIDLAPNNISIAKHLARHYGLEGSTHFTIGITERLDYPCNYFDLVVGVDILHHVDIGQTISESLRVLKPTGTAIFKEPVRAPVFDWLRNTRLGRFVAPNSGSYEKHRTADERKLTTGDLNTIRALCSEMSIRRFRLFCRLDAFYRCNGKNVLGSLSASVLERFDDRVFRAFPYLQVFGGEIVLTLRK